MTGLLDTHAVIWAILNRSELSPAAVSVMDAPGNRILVSAASAWEIATKVRLGKLPGAEPLENKFETFVHRAGYALIPVSVEDALQAGRLAGEHRDPFDRMLAAQALALGIPIISKDTKLDPFGVRRIW